MKLNPRGYTKNDGYRLFKQPPEIALEFFGGKEIVPEWWEIYGEAHAKAFTIAGEVNELVLGDVFASLRDALKNGTTLDDFRADVMSKLQKSGWLRGVVGYDDDGKAIYDATANTTYDRLERIYRTNLNSAYSAGRFANSMDSDNEFWEYKAVIDENTRDNHREGNGEIFHKSDPFWHYFYPENGYNCRCLVVERTEGQLRRAGYDPDEIRAKAREDRVSTRTGYDKNGAYTYHVYDLGGGRFFRADKDWDHNPNYVFYEQRAMRPDNGEAGIKPLSDSERRWADLQGFLSNLGADARGVLTIKDNRGKAYYFTATSFAGADRRYVEMMLETIQHADDFDVRPDYPAAYYGRAYDGFYLVVQIGGLNVNQKISAFIGRGEKIDDLFVAGDLRPVFPAVAP